MLTGKKIQTREEMEQAAEQLSREYGTAIVLKGGHAKTDANDRSMKMGKASGSRENGWSIRIHMEQAARSVRQLPQDWQRTGT